MVGVIMCKGKKGKLLVDCCQLSAVKNNKEV